MGSQSRCQARSDSKNTVWLVDARPTDCANGIFSSNTPVPGHSKVPRPREALKLLCGAIQHERASGSHRTRCSLRDGGRPRGSAGTSCAASSHRLCGDRTVPGIHLLPPQIAAAIQRHGGLRMQRRNWNDNSVRKPRWSSRGKRVGGLGNRLDPHGHLAHWLLKDEQFGGHPVPAGCSVRPKNGGSSDRRHDRQPPLSAAALFRRRPQSPERAPPVPRTRAPEDAASELPASIPLPTAPSFFAPYGESYATSVSLRRRGQQQSRV